MPEGCEVADSYSLSELKVRPQGLLHSHSCQLAMLWDFSQQKPDQGQPLCHRHTEAMREGRRLSTR